jgi:NADPH:quinone reductase-like Zn-dependent oxidoreductase
MVVGESFLVNVEREAEGKIRPLVYRIYRLEEIRDAHARMESNESFGKIVLLME